MIADWCRTLQNRFRNCCCTCCCPCECYDDRRSSSEPQAQPIQLSQIYLEASVINHPIPKTSKPKPVDTFQKKMDQFLIKDRSWKLVSGSAIFEDKTCSICLGDAANIKLQCRHYFHIPCLWIWFMNKSSCPNCRKTTKKLDIFCQVCHYQFYTSTLADVLKERKLNSKEMAKKSICDICLKEKQKQFKE